AAAGALVAIAVASRPAKVVARLDPSAVAVLPFRVAAPDRSLDYLGEGIVDLLAVKLDGPASVHCVPPRQLLGYLGYRPGMEVTSDAGNDAARRAGAGLVLDGSLVRSGAGIELSATLRSTDGRGQPVHATAAGSLDSLPSLVDRLAAQLLAGQRGTTTMLGDLSSARAIAEYLRGKSAHRMGRYQEAVARFDAALREDSTFALAALEEIASAARANDADADGRARRLAWMFRAKLSPKGQALLRAWLGPKYPAASSLLLELAAWQEAVQAAPDVADAWFELGDRQLHNGGTNDLPHAVELAEGNFRRALELDSSFVLPLDHLLLAKLYLEDTTDLRALARRWLAQDSTPGDRSSYTRWRLAIALGDSAAVAHERARLDRWPDEALNWLAGNAQADAVGLGDVSLALREMEHRAVAGSKLRAVRLRRHDWLLNTGRPGEALALVDSLASGEPYPGWARLQRIEDALFWDGDTVAAAADVRALSETSTPSRAGAPLADAIRARTGCRLGLWSLSRGDLARARLWLSRLRAQRVGAEEVFNDDDRAACAILIDAWLASRQGGPEARRLLDRADSIMVESDVMDDWLATDLVTASLREAIGDLPGAVRAIGRVPVALPLSPTYQSTYLREQGRLWLAAGDTASAIRALRRYVAMRANAEPVRRAQRDSVRAMLAALVGR
ncbi:MAG TPA: hypothetical protein VFN40_05655, partial [Gemmatimonadales bacterium]|nr:hypothetical protein [Gemmatimonadales bacterium]